MARAHEPVLLAEALAMLAVRPGGLYVDGTVGLGGHAAAILDAGAPDARLLGFDRDGETLERTRETLAVYGDRVRLAVRDDGAGLDPAMGERAFEPGVRGDQDGSGAGLGLPLARRLARLCGGDVTAGAGPGGCFVLDLPAVR